MVMAEVVVPLTVRDLTREDLPSCAWSGSATHLASVARALGRAEHGEVEYLAVCPPSGLPVALGGIDYAVSPGAGTLWQLAVHGARTEPWLCRTLLMRPWPRWSVTGPAGRSGRSLMQWAAAPPGAPGGGTGSPGQTVLNADSADELAEYLKQEESG
jgi:hypothetical protein